MEVKTASTAGTTALSPYSTPILLVIFNRPDTTAQVFERIRQIRPSRLYVSADAPREGRPKEAELCAEARAIIAKMDWDCELKTLYHETNQGCKQAMCQAMNWFFEQEEYGVILEDDCLPDLSFFPFCEELLIRYKDDDRIGHISGNCFLPGIVKDGLSYDFCSIAHIWGWASWRRVWENFDLNFRFWEDCKDRRSSLFHSKREEIYFTSFIADTLGNRYGLSAWDMQYLYMLRVQHQVSIYPSVNLVTNIGVGHLNAVHTSKAISKFIIPSATMSFPLKHPTYILPDRQIDKKTLKRQFFSYKRLARYILKWY
jgi:hypothetical protein